MKNKKILSLVCIFSLFGSSPAWAWSQNDTQALKFGISLASIVFGVGAIVSGAFDVNNAMLRAHDEGRRGTYCSLQDQPTVGVIKCAVGAVIAVLGAEHALKTLLCR